MKRQGEAALALVGVLAMLLAACDGRHDAKAAAKKALTPDDIAIGMSLTDFRSIFPQVRLTPDGEWNRPDELFGLRGDWTYSFYHNRLAWYIFNSYQSQVDKTNFDLDLIAARTAIKVYTERLGEPLSVLDGILAFQDPAKGYSGYPVTKATWRSKGETIRVDFSVIGTGGEQNQLLFTVEVSR